MFICCSFNKILVFSPKYTYLHQGYMWDLKYQKLGKTKRKQSRNVIYFNPTNVIRLFLVLIDKYFKTGNKLRKCFNRSNILYNAKHEKKNKQA